MPTTVDRFFACVQIMQNLSTMQNQMRSNVQNIKTSHDTVLQANVTSVATGGYASGATTLNVVDATLILIGSLIALNNAQKTVLNVTAKAANALTVTTKQNPGAAAAGLNIAKVSNLFDDFPATQQAVRDLGTAFLQRLDLNQAIYDAYPAEVAAGYPEIGVLAADVGSVHNLLKTQATNMTNAIITTQAQLDNGVNNVLNNVPPAMIPF